MRARQLTVSATHDCRGTHAGPGKPRLRFLWLSRGSQEDSGLWSTLFLHPSAPGKTWC